jgi:hypothetical protein
MLTEEKLYKISVRLKCTSQMPGIGDHGFKIICMNCHRTPEIETV